MNKSWTKKKSTDGICRPCFLPPFCTLLYGNMNRLNKQKCLPGSQHDPKQNPKEAKHEKVRKEISVDVITERHVRSLLKLKNETLQLEALNRIYKGNLNVRQTDDLVEQMLIAEEKNIREQKKKKMVKAIKDMRIFVNTIKGTVKTIQDAGMPAEVIESETDEYMEVVIRLPKKDLNEQQNIAR